MATAAHDFFKICRFCMCDDSELVIPLNTVHKYSLTIEDAEQFTGIEVTEDEIKSYALCLPCTDKLQCSTAYRDSCLANNALFYKRCGGTATELKKICRFCVRDDSCGLSHFNIITHFSLTIEDVEQFTGIEIDADESTSYAICVSCTDKLRSSAAYRDFCLSNDTPFHELYAALRNDHFNASDPIASAQAADAAEEAMELAPVSYTLNELETMDEEDESSRTSGTASIANAPEEVVMGDEFCYSANFIEPEESSVSEAEDEQYAKRSRKRTKPKTYRFVPCVREPGRRRRFLCEICGALVVYLRDHYTQHDRIATHACPHCPAILFRKNNLLAHIRTVHLKTVHKRCDICGKEFVHHKTYRYHMLSAEESVSYSICAQCRSKLKASATYRETCISNDSLFQEISAMLMASEREENTEVHHFSVAVSPTIDESNDLYEDECSQSANGTMPDSGQKDDSCYSANYIVPGESCASDSDGDFYTKPLFRVVHHAVSYERRRGKRKLHLCNFCGVFVLHLKTHFRTHDTEPLLACPYCPAKMTIQYALSDHINTVHLKKIRKTCDICGKGFVHHKTYRYHMLSHKEDGKTFECKACEKHFTSSITLRDHFNRLHNITRKPRVKVPRKLPNPYQEATKLRPITKVTSAALTIEDIEHFTGIEIGPVDSISHAICVHCTEMLKTAAAFRMTCLENNVLFKELSSLLFVSRDCTDYDGIVDYLGLSEDAEETMQDDNHSQRGRVFCLTEIESHNNKPEVKYIQADIAASCASSTDETIMDDGISYCANYIPQGESCGSETEEEDIGDERSTFYPIIHRYVSYKHVRGSRKLPLCDICGRFVTHIPNHVFIHKQDAKFACPYCPVKMKQKPNLTAHMRTVHEKLITKTCAICGQGFVHHKTYKYHLLSHRGKDETYECKPCSKTFPHKIALRDHFNRMHNLGKTAK
uniref:Uncharacterized protein n=1 Tax=Anopheles dirus TaxID=7168 RepID=A0A182NPL0_9DIPT